MESSRPAIRIDLNDFKLHLHFKSKTQLTLHFNSPSRRFYLSVIALVVNEMKRLGKIKSISLQDHLDLLALLNESVGGAAGSSDKENLLPRVYIKWRNALPDLEEAPLFKVLGRKKEEGEGATGKIYSFTEAEKDGWANLFDYIGSDENVRLRFAIDKIGVGLDETSIIFGDYRNGEAWEQFIASLKKEGEEKEEPAPVEETAVPEPPAILISAPQKPKISWLSRYRWVVLVVVIAVVAGAVWKMFLSPARIEVASVDRMKYPLPDKPSIAVLPFVNLSKDPDQEYFSDGMADDLITDLSKISDLLVIARNSTFTYKGKSVKIKQVAEDLGVRYVLEGSVRRTGDEIRINAQLIDAMTGHHVWAERYDGSMKNIFALQDRITQKIVSALSVKLTGTEKQTITQKGTNNIEAYDEFLRGWVHYSRMTPDDMVKAVQSFKKAIELDPNYGQAHAALALAYEMGFWVSSLGKGLAGSGLESRLRAGQYLKQAMKNPTPRAHYINARFYTSRRQHDEALSESERALALDPNHPAAVGGMGRALTYAGKPKEAVDFFNRVIRLDPYGIGLGHLLSLGIAQFCMGNLEEAATVLEKACSLTPEAKNWTIWLIATYSLLGREKDAHLLLDPWIKGSSRKPYLPSLMYFFPFKDRAVADRFAQSLIKSGIKAPLWGYFPAFKENQLTQEEIRRMLFGSKITGIDGDGRQWWEDRAKSGEFTWRGSGPISSDSGMSRIEGDMICTQFQKRLWGVEYCATVFRNPKGTYESKDEYFLCTDFGFTPFSLVK